MTLRPDKTFKLVDRSTFDWFVGRVAGLSESKFPNGSNFYDANLQLVAQSVDGRFYVRK